MAAAVIIAQATSDHDVERSYSIGNHTRDTFRIKPYLNEVISNTKTEHENKMYNGRRHKNPDYECLETRLSTFENWKHGAPLTARRMAEAGFRYEGHSDSVRCYSCGIGIRGWKPDDNPFEEHAYVTSECLHLDLEMGEDYVYMTQKRLRAERNPNGIPDDDTRLQGRRRYNTDMDTGEQMNRQRNGSSVSSGSKPSKFINNPERNDPEYLLEQNTILKENMTCKGCRKTAPNVVFTSCGHLACCYECASATTACPVCKKTVKSFVKIYMS